MNVVDSSAWLEYFVGGPNAAFFAPPIEDTDALVVPSVVMYEVFRQVLQQRGEDAALQAAAILDQGQVVDLDAALALYAAKIGMEEKLPLADSVVLATARRFSAVIWTQDAGFAGRPEVRYRSKRER